MARRPKGNYEAYINEVSSVIALQDEIKKEDKNMMTDTITIWYNYNVKWKDIIQWKKKLQESQYLNTSVWKLSVVITEKHLKCFFKGDRGGRVDDFSTQGVVIFRSLVKKLSRMF